MKVQIIEPVKISAHYIIINSGPAELLRINKGRVMEAVLGVFLVLLGGFSNGSFYMPFKKVKNWSWEVFWIVGGIFSWIIAPWIFSLLTVPNLMGIFSDAGFSQMIKPFVFGILWGIGGLTFGLSMRYLGISLGMAIALGLTRIF